MIFTIVLCFTVLSGLHMCKNKYSRRICLFLETRRGRKMTFQKAKPSRTLHSCINSFGFSRQRKNLINGRSRSEIGHPKAPLGPHFMLLRRPPGDLIFLLVKNYVASTLLAPRWSPLGAPLEAFGPLLQPPWGLFWGPPGGLSGFLCNSAGS